MKKNTSWFNLGMVFAGILVLYFNNQFVSCQGFWDIFQLCFIRSAIFGNALFVLGIALIAVGTWRMVK